MRARGLNYGHNWSVALAGFRYLGDALKAARVLSAQGFTAYVHRVVFCATGQRFVTVFPRKRYPRFEER